MECPEIVEVPIAFLIIVAPLLLSPSSGIREGYGLWLDRHFDHLTEKADYEAALEWDVVELGGIGMKVFAAAERTASRRIRKDRVYGVVPSPSMSSWMPARLTVGGGLPL